MTGSGLKRSLGVIGAWVAVVFLAGVAGAENAARPGEVTPEYPTLKCLGVRWAVGGDDNRNARIRVGCRKAGTGSWKPALDLFRVRTQAIVGEDRPGAGQTLYAGSIFGLDEGTEYELRMSLEDPDGGSAERTLRVRTLREPRLPRGGLSIEVFPDDFPAALAKSGPGDTLRLHKGIYAGTFQPKSGAPGRPIALVGAGDGEAVLDGQGKAAVISAPGLHDVIFEGLTFQNANVAIGINGASRVTIRRSTIRDVEYGIVATRNKPVQHELVISDNTIAGRSTWPRTRGIENRRGVQISGTGSVVCYNRVLRFADGIDTFSTPPCSAIDVYGNDVSECTDDGIEMDYSQHNTRCFENRLTNVFQGISVQPVHGGPVYVFRNALYNVSLETFKLHNNPSGAIFYHNTSVKAGVPLVLFTSEEVSNCVSRNNLFLGTSGNYAYENDAPMRDCDFDRDGFGGQWKLFLKWNRRRYATLEDAAAKAPVYRRAVRVDPEGLFASGVKPPTDTKEQFPIARNDLRLAPGSAAIDAGVVLSNLNDGYQGEAPDLGACELGQPLPHYGPRPPPAR